MNKSNFNYLKKWYIFIDVWHIEENNIKFISRVDQFNMLLVKYGINHLH